MRITSHLSANGKQVRIEISGRFDISLQKEFRSVYRYHQGVDEYCVNLTRTEYVDSSALGMLLILQDHAAEANGKVIIERPSDTVREILLVAKFDEKFTIT